MMRKNFLSGLLGILLISASNVVFAGINFDLVDDSLDCGSQSSLDNVSPVTYSFWIFPISEGGGSQSAFVAKNNRQMRFSSTGINALRFFNNGTTQLNVLSADNVITLSAWNHVLMTWDGSTTAANVHFYVNGTEVSYVTQTNGATLSGDAANNFNIGNQAAASTRSVDGIMTEVAVWGVVLSAQDIAILAKSRVKRMPLQINTSNLKAYWPLDEQPDASSGDADSFFDMSTGGNTCTGNDGADNLGLTAKAEAVLSYP